MTHQFVTIARVVKTQGRQGEVAAELYTDFPERFAERRRLFALDESGTRRELLLQQFWPHKGRMVLKFEGVDSISDAETLVGCEIQLPIEERAELEPGAAYVSDLESCEVLIATEHGERRLGVIAEVQFGAGEAALLVVRDGTKEYLIPFVENFLEKLDIAQKRVVMRLPEGLLELDAPLTPEEKERQRR